MKDPLLAEIEKTHWKENYVQPMFEKFKTVPREIKYALIEKDYSNMMGGKTRAQYEMKYLYDDSETFIFAFDNALAALSKTVKKNVILKELDWTIYKEYESLLKSGFMWEFHPNMSGEWKRDKEEFTKLYLDREIVKEWMKIVLG